jgi:hypothetical protein
MDIINSIRKSRGYDFQELYDLVPFEELHDYINIYSTQLNILLWSIINNHPKSSDLINMYIDYFSKYYDYDGLRRHTRVLLINKIY